MTEIDVELLFLALELNVQSRDAGEEGSEIIQAGVSSTEWV
ncbi:MAG: hypothetical protein Q3X95_07350 [Duodenibacillus sp.]|nr:hypothetical protein [Duodenibacillus sp.]